MDEIVARRRAMGRRIKELRKLRGIKTQDQLVAKSGICIAVIKKLETGTGSARDDTFRKLAKALGVEVAELFAGPEGASVKPLVEGQQMAIDSDDYSDDVETSSMSIVVFSPQPPQVSMSTTEWQRRDFLKLCAGLSSLGFAPVPDRVGRREIDQLKSSSNRLREIGHLSGGGGLVRAMGRIQLQSARALLHARCEEEDRDALFSAVAELGAEAAFAAFDAGLVMESLEIYEFVNSVAEEVGDWQQQCLAYSDMARVATWSGDLERGLVYADRALQRPDRITATQTAMAFTVRARALAAMGRTQDAHRAIGAADEAFARRDCTEHAFDSFYDAAQHQGDTGHALYELAIRQECQPAWARDRLQAAVDGHHSKYARSRAFSRAKLASLLMAHGEPEEAVAIGDVCVSELAAIHSYRATAYLREMGGMAKQPRVRRAARALVEQISLKAPS